MNAKILFNWIRILKGDRSDIQYLDEYYYKHKNNKFKTIYEILKNDTEIYNIFLNTVLNKELLICLNVLQIDKCIEYIDDINISSSIGIDDLYLLLKDKTVINDNFSELPLIEYETRRIRDSSVIDNITGKETIHYIDMDDEYLSRTIIYVEKVEEELKSILNSTKYGKHDFLSHYDYGNRIERLQLYLLAFTLINIQKNVLIYFNGFNNDTLVELVKLYDIIDYQSLQPDSEEEEDYRDEENSITGKSEDFFSSQLNILLSKSNKGDLDSTLEVARIFELGEVVEIDLSKAILYYKKAYSLGHKESKRIIEDLTKLISKL